ncbi:4-nitrophenylphosphatase [Colletotrichum tofieldiae]|uniref:4-nitrophenylphosphatase n=1 Tax=Colletotrichum tofieldiae TaxID=708197 RepID=A0A166XWX6_9PEZI|nr:4-nitrophenylphosphatase [Colletotrichum tofieldiae]
MRVSGLWPFNQAETAPSQPILPPQVSIISRPQRQHRPAPRITQSAAAGVPDQSDDGRSTSLPTSVVIRPHLHPCPSPPKLTSELLLQLIPTVTEFVEKKETPKLREVTMSQQQQPKYLTGDPPAIQEFLDKFDVFLIDCDGVLWSGDHLFDGIRETLAFLRSRGKRTVFVTNNSTKSRPDYHKKFAALDIPSEVEDIFGSAYSSAVYVSRILDLPKGKRKVFVIGEAGIEAELRAEGVDFVGGTDPNLRRDITPEDFAAIADGSALDPEVGVVLAGLDFHINYLKLSLGYQYLRRGAVFLATNTDSTLPMSHTFFPGAGSISIPLINMTQQQPVALGKPSQAMMDAVEGKFQLNRERTCMIGDRLDTDIKFGIEGKLGGTLAVLTGVHKKEDWEKEGAAAVPAYYVDSLASLKLDA